MKPFADWVQGNEVAFVSIGRNKYPPLLQQDSVIENYHTRNQTVSLGYLVFKNWKPDTIASQTEYKKTDLLIINYVINIIYKY